jgi:HSP20 family protein
MANLIRRRRGEEQERERAMATGRPLGSVTLDPFQVMQELMGWEPMTGFQSLQGFVPSFEIKESKDAYQISADLPGVKEDDLDISVTENRVTISGKREEERRKEDERYYAYERSYGSFSRSITMPADADANNIQAELKDGVLRLSIAKQPEAQPKKISLSGKQQEQNGGKQAEGKQKEQEKH